MGIFKIVAAVLLGQAAGNLQTKFAVAESEDGKKFAYSWQDGPGGIAPGVGFSYDKEQMGSERCYNARVSSATGAQSFLKLDQAISFSEIENTLKKNVDKRIGFDFFGFSAGSSYLRSIQEKEYGLSLNYYQYSENQVGVAVDGQGVDALSNTGKQLWASGKNPYFGLTCGDEFLVSYKQGAMLLMNAYINFQSHYEMMNYTSKSGFNFLGLVSSSHEIQKAALDYGFSGSITISGF